MTQDWGQVYWRWLTQEALPLWAANGVDRVRGGFHELLGADLETPKPGRWQDQMRADGSFVEEPSPASSLYHIICAVEALRSHGALTSP